VEQSLKKDQERREEVDGYARQAIIISMIEALEARGSWCGETHIQKCAYVLQEGLNVPLDLQFFLYKHGPFAFDLRETLGEMRANLLIDIESRAPYGSKIFVSEEGRLLRDGFPKTVAAYDRQLSFVSDRLAGLGVAALERLGTALFVLREDHDRSIEAQAQRITDLKPHVNPDLAYHAINQMIELLDDAKDLGLVA
jgi:hypothetical protein